MKTKAEILFPDCNQSIDAVVKSYPKRILPHDAFVTRFAPSPTGYMHIGGLYVALISQRFSRQTGGVYFLRIEDTDKVREIDGTREVITGSLHRYGLDADEGEDSKGRENGAYGPYRQSARTEIYKIFAKHLVEAGRAYPCFCSKADLDSSRQEQENIQATTGYYGKWALCRNLSAEEVEKNILSGKKFVLRLRSDGGKKNFTLDDLIKGKIKMPENDKDSVLVKSDGFPTYHLAHVVDDYLMGTTHVFRSDDWVSSIPLHHELFSAFGFSFPRYGHIPPINKIDGNRKRKLSKRKDPEANVLFYDEIGYPEEAVIEYLLNLANSDFEKWRKDNPDKNHTEFMLRLEKFSNTSGPLFDERKLRDISKEVVARMGAVDVYDFVIEWSRKYDKAFNDVLINNRNLWISIFSIERGGSKTRKDICVWSEVKSLFSYVGQDYFFPGWNEYQGILETDEAKEVVNIFRSVYSMKDAHEVWMGKLKAIAQKYNLAPDFGAFKKDKKSFRGHVGEVAQIIRFAVTGKTQTPDLYQIMKILGDEECKRRLI